MNRIITSLVVGFAALSGFAAEPKVLGRPNRIYQSYFNVARLVYDAAYAFPDTESVMPKFVFRAAESNDLPVAGSKPDGDSPVLARVPGLRNVRDIGGWTGLRTGRVWRGSALVWTGTVSAVEREAAGAAIRDVLKLRTDLDLRGKEERLRDKNGSPRVNLQEFGVELVSVPLGGYLGAFGGGTNAYRKALRVFADPANYPVYVHCAGGADRTGTVIFILEALCGVSERDLAIDYELTSFAKVFGMRRRNDAGQLCYKRMIDRFRADYPGKTINEKVEAYVRKDLGLTESEITAIRANLR